MAKKSVIRIDDNLSTVFNVRITGEYENGFVGKLGDYEDANLDVRALATATSTDSIVIVGNPAIVYDNGRPLSGLETEYTMQSGEVVRAYKPEVGRKISISLEGFTGDVAKGNLVAADGKKLKVVASAPATGTYFKVVKLETVGGALTLNAPDANHTVTYAVLDTVRV